MILVIVIILLMYLLYCEINNTKKKCIEENTFEFIHPASF
jgi:hypothetical protein